MAKVTLTTFFLITFVVLTTSVILGGRTKIKNVKTNKEIQDLGKYSVDEYNRLQRSQKTGDGDLKFSQVVAAESQVVAGTKYYLKIEAVTKSGVKKVFDAEVVDQPWKQPAKQLLTFKPSPKKNF